MHRIAAAAFVAFAWSGAACAGAEHDPVAAAAESFAAGLVQEADVALAFGYARQALAAALEGRELAPPEKLAQRAEAIGEEAKRRGAMVAGAMLDTLERSIREIFRNPPRLEPMPPSAPFATYGAPERIRY